MQRRHFRWMAFRCDVTGCDVGGGDGRRWRCRLVDSAGQVDSAGCVASEGQVGSRGIT